MSMYLIKMPDPIQMSGIAKSGRFTMPCSITKGFSKTQSLHFGAFIIITDYKQGQLNTPVYY